MFKRPIIRKSLINFLSFSTSDYLSQLIENHYFKKDKKEFNTISYNRILKHGLLGVAMTPIYHFQYSYLEPKLFKPKFFLRRMLFDQVIACPIQNFIFFTVQGVIQQKSLEATKQKMKRVLVPTLVNGYKVWPLFTGLTFKYIPQAYTEYTINFFGMVWGIYLSYMGHK